MQQNRSRLQPIFYTLTPNPALDVSGTVKNLTPNEKNTVFHEKRDPGGNGINASRIAHRLGTRTLALGFRGGPTGEELLQSLNHEKVPHAFQQVTQATRINITVTDIKSHLQTRLSFAGPIVRKSEQEELLQQIRTLRSGGLILLGGSLPQGVPEDFHARLAEAAHRAGLGILLDVPSQTLKKTLGASRIQLRPLVVKPNETELAEWWSNQKRRTFKSEIEFHKAGLALARQCTLVCVSRGEKGLELFHHQQHWTYQSPRVKARGTVGAGDSFLGGLASGLLKEGLLSAEKIESLFDRQNPSQIPASLHHAINLGISCGAATASETGTSLGKKANIETLLKKTTRLNRPLLLGKVP